jgi:hypothetical protein
MLRLYPRTPRRWYDKKKEKVYRKELLVAHRKWQRNLSNRSLKSACSPA